ncbi:T9SS type B sorting domain-containing protein [Winogradskyella jejuensis]|uniref:Gliding motility-associated C-terminal domain-containing protein n=1 Tax=Winogradskyella jejuensis TaxID=1089305 RepID=A0A1M5RZA7_9FLAO|nr:T9SS type B sorting domain-containing protein [Winogradskyella jejuensis]SHH31143.1 gliding motility-associated C-terminal domain-containing protein [Winogradskyella jejuensis]
MKNIITLFFVFNSFIIFSQDLIMQPGTFNQCTGTFFDSGGGTGNYSSNEDIIITICPDTPGDLVRLNFTAFNTEDGVDIMTIFNGDDETAPPFGDFTGTTSPNTVQATQDNTTGCITVQFVSNGFGNTTGWAADISCITNCQIINSQIDTASPSPNGDGYIRVCPNEEITLTGSATFSDDGTGATYQWDLGDGNTIDGTTATFSYPDPGVYIVNLNVRDANTDIDPLGCQNNNLINQVIQVSNEPDFTGTEAAQTQICIGESTTITGQVVGVLQPDSCTPPFDNNVDLPDGSGDVYQTETIVDCFDSSAVLTDASEILNICINMEHSYVGDLDITIVSPNGQEADLFQSSLAFGESVGESNGADDGVPGVGSDYCFSMGAAVPLTAAPIITAGSPPVNTFQPGTYLPVESFANLVGSPLNGTWIIRVTDNFSQDDGTIFSWDIEFDPSIVPPELSFTPVIVSESWDTDPSITNTTGNTITVEPATLGQHCYTYRAVNDFGCEYTEEVCIDVVDLDNPSFTVTPACGGGTASITGDPGGTFALNPVPTDGAVINPTTGEVTGGGSAVTYTVEYTTAGICPQTSTQNLTTLVSDVDPSFTIAPTCDGGTVTITGDTGGVFTFNPVPTDGATIDAATGEVTNGISGTTYTVEYTTSGTCILSSTQDVTVIIADDSSFTVTPTCDGGTATITGATGGTFAFNPMPTDGAVIDTVTGEVTNGLSGSTYTIEYTTSGTCPTVGTENLTVAIQDDASFTMTPTCDGGTATITGDAGGTFSFNPIPTDGAVIDASSGEVTNGTSATTYTIEYTTSGTCPDTSTQDVTVLTADNPSFTITATCDGGTASITGDAGGTFAFNPVPTDGALIDTVTGEVTNGTSATTYTIEYTTAGTCLQSSTQDVTVLTADDPSFTVTPTCDGGTATITGDIGGIFAFNPVPTDGAVIDSATGEVTNGVSATTYTIEYTTVGTCPQTQAQNLTVITADDSSFTMTPTCDGGVATITGAAGGTFSLNPVPTDGAVIDAVTGDVTGGTFGTTYTVQYLTAGTCPTMTTQNLTVLTQDDASFTVAATCDGGVVTITGDTGGTFAFNPLPTDGAVINSTTGEVTNGTSATTYTIEYTTAGACPDTSTQDITVLTADDPTFTVTPTCDGGTATITGDTGGTFAFNPLPTDGAVIDAATGEVTNATSATTYTIEYTTAGTCFQASTQNLTVITADDASFTVSPTCDGGVVTITGLAGGIFTFNVPPTDGAIIDTSTGEVTNGTPGETYAIEYSVSDICPNSSVVTFTANPLPDDSAVVTDFFECENNTDFLFDFDLESKTDEILNGQNPMDFTVTYHENQLDADNLANPITGLYENMMNPQTIYVAITNNATGCSVSTISFNIEVQEGANPVDDFYEECDVVGDNDGSTQFDLASRSPIILNGQDPTEFSISYHFSFNDAFDNEDPLPLLYENLTNPQTIYARVSSNIRPDECFVVAELTLQTNLLPIFDLDDEYILCLTSNNEAVVPIPPVLDTGLSDADYTFEWSLNGTVLPTETGSSLTPTQGGTYDVVVTDISTSSVTMCQNFDSAEVIESGIPDGFDVNVTSLAFTSNNMIIATATGNSTYEFSLDNGPWELVGEFENVTGGEHTVYVRDVNGCGILSRDITVIDYPKFFTPNGDGNNDTWTVKGIDTQPTAVIYIHDRYGKLLKQLSPTSPGWDGTYNGNLMPSSDYWFTLQYSEPTTGEMKSFSAHFALKR